MLISIGLTGPVAVRVGLHQGSSLSPDLFDMILDVMGRGIKEQPPWCMLFAGDIVLCSTRRDHVERKLGEWRRAMGRLVEGRLNRGDRGWLSHGLVVTLPISYSLDGGTLWGFTRDMRIAD